VVVVTQFWVVGELVYYVVCLLVEWLVVLIVLVVDVFDY